MVVHSIEIFQCITNFIRFIVAKEGITVVNYIDDIYACCYKDQADTAFKRLTDQK